MALETILTKVLFFKSFLLALREVTFWQEDWALGYHPMKFCARLCKSYALMHEFYMACTSIRWLSRKRAMLRPYCWIFEFCHCFNMNDNPENNILMSENIGQEKKTNNFGIFRCTYFSSRGIFLEYFDAYICICHYYIFHSWPKSFKRQNQKVIATVCN